jgi:hypothetical protein
MYQPRITRMLVPLPNNETILLAQDSPDISEFARDEPNPRPKRFVGVAQPRLKP